MKHLLFALCGLLLVGCSSASSPGRPSKSVAFSADGKYLASGDLDAYVNVWDAVTLLRFACVKGEGTNTKLVAFAPDRPILASIHEYDSGAGVRLWDLSGGKLTARGTLEGPGPIHSLAFSPNGKLLALGMMNGVSLWEVGGEPFRKLASFEQGEILSTAFDSSSKRLALCGGRDPQRIRIWDVSGQLPTKIATLELGQPPVWSVTFSPDGKLLASGEGFFEGGKLRVWNDLDKTPSEQAAVEVGDGRTQAHVFSVAFAPDGSSLASAHSGCIRLWNLGGVDLKERLVLTGAIGSVEAIAFAPDGKRIAAAVWGHGIKVWDLSGPTPKEREWLK